MNVAALLAQIAGVSVISESQIIELADYLDKEQIFLIPPDTYQWQEHDNWTAYKNFTNPSGCELGEDKNPIRAIAELIEKLKEVK